VRENLLPVPYFHVVHTLPHDRFLDRLVLANRRVLLALLFRATAATLLELAADPRYLGARIGLLMVLHTWGQLLDTHFHVHVVVPGGGLSLDGTRWLSFRRFFLPVHVISALFRGKFLAGLKQLRIRYYGLLSNRCRRVELVRCRALLGMKVVALADGVRSSSALELEEVKLVSSSDSPRCPQCGGSGLVVVELGPSLCAERSRSAAVLRKHGVGQTFEEFMSRQRKGAIAASGRGNHNVDSS
jgi:hypothetical protein